MTHDPATQQAQRFGRLIERHDDLDFPFYQGEPIAISGSRWLVVITAVALGLVALTALPLEGPLLGFVPPILFVGLPLVALAWASHGHWRTLFHRVGLRDVGLMVAFAVINIVVTFAAGAVARFTTGTSANPEAGVLAAASPLELATFYPRTAIQLLGKDLLTILPFLAVMWLFVAKLRVGVRRSPRPQRLGAVQRTARLRGTRTVGQRGTARRPKFFVSLAVRDACHLSSSMGLVTRDSRGR